MYGPPQSSPYGVPMSANGLGQPPSARYAPQSAVLSGAYREDPRNMTMGLDLNNDGNVTQTMQGPLGVDVDNDGTVDLVITPEMLREFALSNGVPVSKVGQAVRGMPGVNVAPEAGQAVAGGARYANQVAQGVHMAPEAQYMIPGSGPAIVAEPVYMTAPGSSLTMPGVQAAPGKQKKGKGRWAFVPSGTAPLSPPATSSLTPPAASRPVANYGPPAQPATSHSVVYEANYGPPAQPTYPGAAGAAPVVYEVGQAVRGMPGVNVAPEANYGQPAQPTYPEVQPVFQANYGPPAQPAYPEPQPVFQANYGPPAQPVYPEPQPVYGYAQPSHTEPAQPVRSLSTAHLSAPAPMPPMSMPAGHPMMPPMTGPMTMPAVAMPPMTMPPVQMPPVAMPPTTAPFPAPMPAPMMMPPATAQMMPPAAPTPPPASLPPQMSFTGPAPSQTELRGHGPSYIIPWENLGPPGNVSYSTGTSQMVPVPHPGAPPVPPTPPPPVGYGYTMPHPTPAPQVQVVEKVIEKVVEKPVYIKEVVEKVVEKPVYHERVIERPMMSHTHSTQYVERPLEATIRTLRVQKTSHDNDFFYHDPTPDGRGCDLNGHYLPATNENPWLNM